MRAFALSVALLSNPAVALDLKFAPAEPMYAEAAAEYQEIWAAEGSRIVAALEERACAEFPVHSVAVTVVEAPSFSGRSGVPMRLRASYPEPVKRGMLVHELGHWLIERQALEDPERSVHQALNLLLIQVWEDLWGPDFVRSQIATESRLTESYRSDWEWALSLDHQQRRSAWASILEASGRPTMCSSRPPGICFVRADRCRPAAA